MILDNRQPGDLGLQPEAVVVVGSGAAGLALALELGDRGRSVVLLESGGDVADPAAVQRGHRLNAGVVAGRAYRCLEHGRARVLGGTTQLWHGQCVRLHEIDLRERPWVPGSGWPLALAELDGPYTRAEALFGVSGRGYDAHRWSGHGRLARVDWDPELLEHDFTEYSPSPFLGTAFRSRLARHPHVQVVLWATVSRVTFDGDAVTGVAVLDPLRARRHIPATEVVLAAGAVENPRLLQLSDPEGVGLGTGRAHTGHFLQDHPVVATAEVVTRDHHLLQDRYTPLHGDDARLFPKVRPAAAAQERLGLLDATAVFVHEHDQTGFDAVRRLLAAARTRRWPAALGSELRAAVGAAGPLARAVYRRRVKGLSSGGRPERVTLQVWVEQAPDAASRVTLDTSLDPLGMRRPRVDWRVGPLERETKRAITRFVEADLRRLGLGELRMLPTQVSDEAFAAAVSDAFHPSGTTRMSVSPTLGVVDRDLRVHGCGGCRWWGAASSRSVVMPTRRSRSSRSRCGWPTRWPQPLPAPPLWWRVADPVRVGFGTAHLFCGRTTRRGRPRCWPRCWPRCSRCLSGSSTPHRPTATAARRSG